MMRKVFLLLLLCVFLSASYAQVTKMKDYYGRTFLGKTTDGVPLIFVINHNGNIISTASGNKMYFLKELGDVNIYKAGHDDHTHYYGFQSRDKKSLFFAVLDDALNTHTKEANLTPAKVKEKMQERKIVIVLR